MRISRAKKNNESAPQSKLTFTRSTSSISAQNKTFSSKSPENSQHVLKSSFSESKKAQEKNNSTDLFTLDSSNICKYCSATKDYESKIFLSLNEIHSSLRAILSSYESWNSAQTPKFKSNLHLNSFSSDSEILKKLSEISEFCIKINQIFEVLTKDLDRLSKTSAWKNVKIRKPAQAGVAYSLQESFEKARSHLNWLKNATGVSLLDKSEDLNSRCLQMELLQSWRDRRALEIKLAASDRNSPDCVLKTIERVLVEEN